MFLDAVFTHLSSWLGYGLLGLCNAASVAAVCQPTAPGHRAQRAGQMQATRSWELNRRSSNAARLELPQRTAISEPPIASVADSQWPCGIVCLVLSCLLRLLVLDEPGSVLTADRCCCKIVIDLRDSSPGSSGQYSTDGNGLDYCVRLHAHSVLANAPGTTCFWLALPINSVLKTNVLIPIWGSMDLDALLLHGMANTLVVQCPCVVENGSQTLCMQNCWRPARARPADVPK